MSLETPDKKSHKSQSENSKKKPKRTHNAHDNEASATDTDSDAENTVANTKNTDKWNGFESDRDSDHGPVAQRTSPLKRKRSNSLGALNEDSDTAQTPVSLNEFDLADLGNSEDDLDIEQFEGEQMIQEEEDRDVIESKFNILDDSQPFAYVADDQSEHSNPEEYWLEDFDALESGAAILEHQATPIQLRPENSQDADALLEDDFFYNYLSSDSDDGTDDDDESPFGDDDDRVGWECFFSTDGSDSDSDEDESMTTDDERSTIIANYKAGKAAPVTPARLPAKSGLTSCLKQANVSNDKTPTKSISSTPIKLNTSHKAPILGVFKTNKSSRTIGIIDGRTCHSPLGLPKPDLKSPKKKRNLTKLSPATTEAMTSLDDIMYTSDLTVPQQKAVPSKFNMPVHIGAFRKGQQRSSLIKEDSFKDEWYNMTSRRKATQGRTKATPILGVASESLSRREKRRRRKMKASMGTSVGGSTFGGSTFGGSIDEQSDNEFNDGIERAGLGLGVPVESLFLFHEC